MCSRLGLFVAPMEQIVSTIPELLYDYLVKDGAKWVARFFASFDRISIVDIFRELLDLPSYNERPWWVDSSAVIDHLLDALKEEKSCFGAELTLWTIITRGIPSKTKYACEYLVSSLLEDFHVDSIVQTATASELEDVSYACFRSLARIFWDVPDDLYSGVGDYERTVYLEDTTSSQSPSCCLPDESILQAASGVDRAIHSFSSFLNRKMEGSTGSCPKSVIGMSQFIRYYCIRCSGDQFANMADAGLLDLFLKCLVHYPSCSLVHYQISKAFSTVMDDEEKQSVLLMKTNLISFLEEHRDDKGPYLEHIRMIARRFLSVEHGVVSRLKGIMNFAQVIPPETYMGYNSVLSNIVPMTGMSQDMEDLKDEVEIVPDMDDIPDIEELPEFPEFPMITPPGITSYGPEQETGSGEPSLPHLSLDYSNHLDYPNHSVQLDQLDQLQLNHQECLKLFDSSDDSDL